MITSLCVIVRRPKGEELSTLGIRTVYATFMGGMDAKLLCIEDGVFNLLDNPGYNTEMLNELSKEGAPIYALTGHLQARGLSESNLIAGVQVIDPAEVAEIIEASASVAAF
ncbi:MAG: hypothetical protein FJ009_09495 [Chloroflexi bacterium]|nr:hypothetical protein [Chloroflexota bacterium]